MKLNLFADRTNWGRRGILATSLVGIAAGALVLTGCTSGAGTGTDSGADGGGKGITIAIMGGATDDPFWSKVKTGAEAAMQGVEAAGGKVTFVAMPNYDDFNADAAKLVANIAALNPTAAIIPDWAPQAQNDNIKALTAAGIPVFIYNTGQDEVENVGALAYIGSDDFQTGQLSGTTLAEAGAKHIVCVNTLPGVVNSDTRCAGVKDGAEGSGAEYTELPLPTSSFGDPSAVAQAIKGTLLTDPTIDGIFADGEANVNATADGIKQAGVDVLLGGHNFDQQALDRIKDGTQLFAVDQQGYAQGYYAVSAAFQYVAYGIGLANPQFLTGPVLINKDNVETVEVGIKFGAR